MAVERGAGSRPERRRRRPWWGVVLIAATAVVVLRLLHPPADAELDGLRVVTSTERDRGSASDANIIGELVAVGSCVGIGGEDGGPSSLVVWPRGTKVDGDEVVTPGGIRVRLGEELRGGGGYGASPATLADILDPDVPADCLDASSEVAQLNGED